MLIVAKTIKGQEFIYSSKSAHQVSKKSGKKICELLNKAKYQLYDDVVWHLYNVDKYDNAFDYASFQSFKFINHTLREYR